MSGTATKEKLTVRHLLVVLTGIMITFGCSALCFSTWGLFQPVVAEGLGVEVTAFAMYVTVMYLTMTIARRLRASCCRPWTSASFCPPPPPSWAAPFC